jgi:hypothetical protein
MLNLNYFVTLSKKIIYKHYYVYVGQCEPTPTSILSKMHGIWT